MKEAIDLAERFNALRRVIADVHSQHADDLCWLDIDRIFAAAGLPIPDRRVGDKAAMLKNCERFVNEMCAGGGGWKSYAELEADLARQKEVNLQLADRLAAASAALTNRAERFEQGAFVEGWHCGHYRQSAFRAASLQNMPPELVDAWLKSRTRTRLKGSQE